MAKHDINSIRNLAIVGHGSAGKTVLGEALLLEAGIVTRVPSGTFDYAVDEKEQGRSIDSSLAQFSWGDTEFTVIDVPGYQEFFHNSVNALSAIETSIIVVSAADGVTVNTRRVWELSRKKGLATFFVITKLDGENVSFEDTVSDIQKHFGDKCIPLTVPNAVGGGLSEVYDVFEGKHETEYRESLLESIVETNDEMLDKYFADEKISEEDLKKQFKTAIVEQSVFPILTVVPPKSTGVKEFLTTMTNLAPAPNEVKARLAKVVDKEEEKSFDLSADAPFTAQVFKIFNDPFGRLVYFRILSGTLASSSPLYIANLDKTERIGNLLKTVGKDQTQVEKAVAGEIVAIAKVENVQLGHTFCNEKDKVTYSESTYSQPMVSLAVQPLSRSDEQKISSSLIKLSEEDKTFKAHRDEETAELIVSGMSNLHLDIVLNRLKNRFKVDCSKKLPKIAYRETITSKADKRYRHKKQSGGHGQFGEVAIKLEPTERGVHFEFVNKIVGGVIPSQFIASTEKGIQNSMKKGILAGYPVVDVRAYLYDGKTHDVDSSDAAFQMAGSRAFQEGFVEAKPVLLEPIQDVKITIPQQFMGDIMGDLNSRRGRIMGSDSEGDSQVVNAQVPLAEIQTYSADLKSITGGEGNYTMKFSHYDVVPSHQKDKIIAQAKQEAEEKN